jgi:DNA-binding HxlR family transcriptional regulator
VRTYACPVELALDVLGGKWRVVILARLKEASLRYAGLRRLVPTQRLHELVDAGLVSRTAGVYAITERGRSARTVLEALYAWGEQMAPAFDARIVPPA